MKELSTDIQAALASSEELKELVDSGMSDLLMMKDYAISFSQKMVRLKELSPIVSGKGTMFSTLAKECWGMNHHAAGEWLKIGISTEKLFHRNNYILPSSRSALYELTKLTKEEFDELYERGQITASTTRQSIIRNKDELYEPDQEVIDEAVKKQRAKDKAAYDKLSAKAKAEHDATKEMLGKSRHAHGAIKDNWYKELEEAKILKRTIADLERDLIREQLLGNKDNGVDKDGIRKSKMDAKRLDDQIHATRAQLNKLNEEARKREEAMGIDRLAIMKATAISTVESIAIGERTKEELQFIKQLGEL